LDTVISHIGLEHGGQPSRMLSTFVMQEAEYLPFLV